MERHRTRRTRVVDIDLETFYIGIIEPVFRLALCAHAAEPPTAPHFLVFPFLSLLFV